MSNIAEPTDSFYNLLDKYNAGVEPISNWTTEDLVKLIDVVDAELQNRTPPDSTYQSDDNEYPC